MAIHKDEPVREAVVKEIVKEETEKDVCLKKMELILAENGGLISNIPMSSEYWTLANQYRGM